MNMDGGKFRDTMHSLNYGTVMEAAARNYMEEKTREDAHAKARARARVLDAKELCEVRDDARARAVASAIARDATRRTRGGTGGDRRAVGAVVWSRREDRKTDFSR
jgi:hypothetical protein